MFTFVINEQDLAVISHALGTLPFSQVSGVIKRMQDQLDAQRSEKPAPVKNEPLPEEEQKPTPRRKKVTVLDQVE